jgi:formylglycine-generating enzyme required for sulfatase activity
MVFGKKASTKKWLGSSRNMSTTKACCTPSAQRSADAGSVAPATHLSSLPADPGAPMIELPGGRFLMGTDDPSGFPQDGEGPVRPVVLAPFSIDRYPVTNDLFAQFIRATGYVTEAGQYGWSFVFWAHLPQDRLHELVEDTVQAAPWWCKVSGATWSAPEGPGSDISTRGNYPVVHVTWNDAQAFCNWIGRRLPTEAEWEYAARGGLEQKTFPWGDELCPEGKHLCNIWQGEFPNHDTAEDGYAGTCPVDAFPPNGHGLYSVTGNTWEWCADWFEAGQTRVMKGGSFLCHASYCNRYRVGARSSNTPDSSTSNIGFRCAL